MSNINFKDYLNEQLQDPEFKKEFENETTKLESAIALTKARRDSGLSQRDLSTIARIESGANTSIDTLTKIANALGKRLTVNFS